ncbi:hypothetical protein D1Y78_09740 [Riemerella anatipestifer]|nr:hypothetical protein [Riemerella anatipestifer]
MKSVNIYPQMLFNSTIFNNLVSLKKHLLWLVEIELLVQFSPTFANTFSVTCNFTQKLFKNEKSILFIEYHLYDYKLFIIFKIIQRN